MAAAGLAVGVIVGLFAILFVGLFNLIGLGLTVFAVLAAVVPSLTIGSGSLTVTYARFDRPPAPDGAAAAATNADADVVDQPTSDPTETTKICPQCAEVVRAAARICRYCRYEFAAP